MYHIVLIKIQTILNSKAYPAPKILVSGLWIGVNTETDFIKFAYYWRAKLQPNVHSTAIIIVKQLSLSKITNK